MKALLIEFNARTGKRAGDISPRDIALPCYGWQDLESKPAREIRLVNDSRDLNRYRNVPGITVLNGRKEINQVIDEVVHSRFKVIDEALMLESIRQEGVILKSYFGLDRASILSDLYSQGIVGIVRQIPKKLDESGEVE